MRDLQYMLTAINSIPWDTSLILNDWKNVLKKIFGADYRYYTVMRDKQPVDCKKNCIRQLEMLFR